jgi:hypothetical protein
MDARIIRTAPALAGLIAICHGDGGLETMEPASARRAASRLVVTGEICRFDPVAEDLAFRFVP